MLVTDHFTSELKVPQRLRNKSGPEKVFWFHENEYLVYWRRAAERWKSLNIQIDCRANLAA